MIAAFRICAIVEAAGNHKNMKGISTLRKYVSLMEPTATVGASREWNRNRFAQTTLLMMLLRNV